MSSLALTAQPGFRPMLAGLSHPLFVDDLPVLDVETSTIVEGVANVNEFNLLTYIAYFGGQFIATWAAGATQENDVDQGIVYATSPDAVNWSPVGQVTTTIPPDWMYGAAGLWERDGELYALYRSSEISAGPDGSDAYYGPSLVLMGQKWTGSGWGEPIEILSNVTLDEQPQLLRTGKWYATGRDRFYNTTMILGDIDKWTRIIVPSPEGVQLNECTILPIGDGSVISYEYRNNQPMEPRFLLRSFSFNNGGVISEPKVTNFPDAQSRRCTRQLSDGRYVMCSNANWVARRKKLMLSVSDDGLTYDRVYILRGEPTSPKFDWTNPAVVNGRTGYQYPHILEKDGALYIIYSRNKEDIQVSKVELSAFA